MELLAALIISLVVASTGGFLPESKNNNQSKKIKVIQTQEIKTPVAEVKPEPVQKVEVKPEPVQKVEVRPEPVQKVEVRPEPVQEETSWFNIVLYMLGAFVIIATGIYFFVRGKNVTSINQVDARKQEFNEEKIPELQEQQEPQQEPQQEQQEVQTDEITKDNSSDDNDK